MKYVFFRAETKRDDGSLDPRFDQVVRALIVLILVSGLVIVVQSLTASGNGEMIPRVIETLMGSISL
ncbi:MAG: hypothetical protein KJ734_14245 [Chloroflexi bacterium]|nr:hypothetical protein [Chloroflexota bacterium]